MAKPVRAPVPDDLDGERADKVVAVLAGASRAQARALCDEGLVEVEGEVVAAKDRLRAGAVIEFPEVAAAAKLEPEPVDFTVRFEDDHLLVVDKPAGLVVHPGAGRSAGTLAAGLLHRYPEILGVGEEGRWGLVHRLDRETSGLLLVARTAEAHDRLSRMIAAREVTRAYLALVEGRFDVPRGTIDAPIDRDPLRPTRRAVTPGGRAARTHYRLVRQWEQPPVALLEVTLETGRTHQIRVHLASIEHPLVGDRVYGRPGPVDSPRVFLHATRLEMRHPFTREDLVVESRLPDDLQSVLASISPT